MAHLLLLGDPAPGGLAGSLETGFRSLGLTVRQARWPPPLPRLRRRIALHAPQIVEAQWRALLSDVASEADLCLVVKGSLLTPSRIAQLRQRVKAPVVCWNPDSPFDDALSNRLGGQRDSTAAYDAYVTYGEALAERLSGAGTPAVSQIPFGWDDHLFSVPKSIDPDLAERLVFVGTWTRERQARLSDLRAFRPVVYGNSWPRKSGLEVRSPVFGQALCTVLASAGACLNFLRPQNVGSHNMRTFEIAACGGRQIADYSPEHEKFLEATGAWLAAPSEMPSVIGHVLSQPRKTPVMRSEMSGHTYRVRCSQFLQKMQQLP